jgi:molecular chaperone DnaK
MLGGQDFDRILIAEVIRPWLMETFSLPEDFQKQDKYGRLIGKSLMAAEAAKIDLSTANASTIFMSDEDIRVQDQNGTDVYLDTTVTRQQFEELVEPLLVQTLEMSRTTIKANGNTAQDIDRIVFVGGPSKMPWIRERVPRELGVAADLSVDPMTAVAMGAAMRLPIRIAALPVSGISEVSDPPS